MSGGALKLRDVRKLADTRAELDLEYSVAELPGMPPEVGGSDGRVHAQLRFGREQGFAIADVSLRRAAAGDLPALHGADAADRWHAIARAGGRIRAGSGGCSGRVGDVSGAGRAA